MLTSSSGDTTRSEDALRFCTGPYDRRGFTRSHRAASASSYVIAGGLMDAKLMIVVKLGQSSDEEAGQALLIVGGVGLHKYQSMNPT